MRFLVLGITGKRGSGKDTVAEYLKRKYGFHVLTYTEHVLSPILREQGKPVTRENLISLALEMRKKGGKHVLTKLICDKIGKEGHWAISGVRYPEEHEYFRKRFGRDFKLLDIVCDARKRYERILKRGTKGEGEMTFEEFMEIEKKETEKMIEQTEKLADFLLDNNGTMEELYENVDILAKKLGISRSP